MPETSDHRRRRWSLGVLAVSIALPGLACSTDDARQPPAESVLRPGEEGAPQPPAVRDLAALAPQLERLVTSTVADLGVPGAEVLVERGGQQWAMATGTADIGSGVPVEAGTAWPIRSITKSFTVTLLLQLVDEGVVDLDDAIGNWVQGVPGGDVVTLRQLADMTSGLPEYTTAAFIDDFLADPTRMVTTDELLAYAGAEPARAEPGTDRVYTNTNTLLLGRVVELATGQSFAQALGERLLGPLGLSRTVYPTDPSQWGVEVTGYAPDAEAGGALVPQPVNFSVFGPAGAMIATLEDLARWGRPLADGSLLRPETQTARVQGGPLDEGPEYDRYALGIGTLRDWWGHTGEGFGFTALVMHDLRTDTTVAIAMNASQLERHAPTVLFERLAPVLTPP